MDMTLNPAYWLIDLFNISKNTYQGIYSDKYILIEDVEDNTKKYIR